MKKHTRFLTVLISVLMIIGLGAINNKEVKASANYYLNYMDGNGAIEFDISEITESILNPTTYNCELGYNPFGDSSDVKFAGWIENGEDGKDYIIEKSGPKYVISDFENCYSDIYYAAWVKDDMKPTLFLEEGYGLFFGEENKDLSIYGINWEYSETKSTLTLENANIVALGGNPSNSATFMLINDTTIVLKGNNNIGGEMAFNDMKFDPVYNDAHTRIKFYKANCFSDAIACIDDEEQLYNVSIKGDGSLTIYEYQSGITAKTITFDKEFTGTLNIYDKGAITPHASVCCLKAEDGITINNGTINLYNFAKDKEIDGTVNTDTQAIYSENGELTFNGGKLMCCSNNRALNIGDTFKIINGTSIIANEAYSGTGDVKNLELDNETLTGYSIVKEYSSSKYIKLEKGVILEEKKEEPKSDPVDTTCEAVIGKDWTWDETLGVCKLKGYRLVNTATY